MKRNYHYLLFVSLAVVVGCGRPDRDPNQTVKPKLELSHFIEETITPREIRDASASELLRPSGTEEILSGVIALNQIVNVGATVWNLVEKNRPVSHVSTVYANGIPEGVSSMALENFSDLQLKSFR